MIRTEIELTERISLTNLYKAIQRIECAYNEKEYVTTVHIESGDLTDDVHRLVFVTEIKKEKE